MDVKDQFLEDLQSLLDKYAPIEVIAEDHYSGYSECGSDVRMTVSIEPLWDKDGNQTRDAVEINLGNYIGSRRG